MTLCHLCNHALSNRVQYQDASIHSTLRSFSESIDEGCGICQELFRQTPDEWQQELRRRVQISGSSAEEQRNANESQWGLTSYSRPSQRTRYGFVSLNLRRIVLDTDPPWNAATAPANPRLVVYPVAAGSLLWNLTSPTTDSEETFTKIKAWLSRCGKAHTKCGLRRDEADVGWHPTRLIEVAQEPRTSGHADNIRGRLVELGPENTPDLKYISLSHRWPLNLEGFQKLTVDKLPLWKNKLPIETLSQTFRDTLLVAYKLGISYVWIDSLCIIQEGDDYADWRKEAPMMQKVYSNAQFNICASKKNNQGEHFGGLFSPREPPHSQPLQVKFPKVDGDTEYDDSGNYLIRDELRIAEVWAARMDESPLASRGWVFQEQLLSRANIHFGDQEVLFECLEMRASEHMGSDQDYERPGRGFETYFKERLPMRNITEGGIATDTSRESSGSDYGYDKYYEEDYDEYMPWHKLLIQYTALQLTKSSDRLIALSGVAQYFKKVLSHNDYYVAGLWRSRLLKEMLWELTEASSREDWEKRKKTRPYLTFSWLSVDGTVQNRADSHRRQSEGFRPLAELEAVKYRSSPEAGEGEPFAEDILSLPLAPAVEIRITGLLRPMSLKPIDPPPAEQIWPGMQLHAVEGLDLLLDPLGKRRCIDGKASLDFEIGPSEMAALNKSGRLYLMPLTGQDGFSTWILLLELVETSDGEGMGRFRRIGVHEDKHFGPVDDWLAKNMPPEDSFSKLPCWRYDDVSKQHTIFVV